MKQKLYILALFIFSLFSNAQTTETLPYHKEAGIPNNGYLETTLTNFSTCQSSVSANLNSLGYSNGIWYSADFNYYVNDILVGSGFGNQTFDISEFIPVNSVKIVRTGGNKNWNQVFITVNVTSTTSTMPVATTVSNITYSQNETASPLNATLNGNGHALKWYASAVGASYTAEAPTPSTASLGSNSYFVAQEDVSGCESLRKEIVVTVEEALSIGNTEKLNNTNIYPNPTNGNVSITFPKAEVSKITLYDLNGRLLLNKENHNKNFYNLDLSNHKAGVYILRIQAGEYQIIKRILKQ